MRATLSYCAWGTVRLNCDLTSETLRDLIGKRMMDATETGAELLACDMMNGA